MMVSAAAKNGGSQSGITLLLSRKAVLSPGQLRWLEPEPPAFDWWASAVSFQTKVLATTYPIRQ
jgi:hypothetical protein